MNDRPWMTALEMQFAAARLTHDVLGSGDGPTDLMRLSAVSCYALKHATAFAWTEDSTKAVIFASRTIPDKTIIPTLTLPEGVRDMWWWFDNPLPIWKEPNHPYHIVAMLATPTEDMVSLILVGFCTSPLGMPTPCVAFRINPGTTLENISSEAPGVKDRIGVDPTDGIRLFIAGCSWLDQKILTINSGHIERHRRKQLSRDFETVVSDVKVIQLRRAEHDARPMTEPGDPIEWSCRWIVNGHWRNQAYANGEHKLIYIMPYVKGPEDKPLKVPTHTVYQVSR